MYVKVQRVCTTYYNTAYNVPYIIAFRNDIAIRYIDLKGTETQFL